MNILRSKTTKFAICVIVAALCVALCAALSACDKKSTAPLPTDSSAWVLESIVVDGESSEQTYSVALAEKLQQTYPVSDDNTEEENEANMKKWVVYEGMYLDSTTVTVDFAGDIVVVYFSDGRKFSGKWRQAGESYGTAMIEYEFSGEDASYGTCGRVEEQDGTRRLQLYVVIGNTTYIFTAAA